MDDLSLQVPATGVGEAGEELIGDLLAELMGSWDEAPVTASASASAESAVEFAAAAETTHASDLVDEAVILAAALPAAPEPAPQQTAASYAAAWAVPATATPDVSMPAAAAAAPPPPPAAAVLPASAAASTAAPEAGSKPYGQMTKAERAAAKAEAKAAKYAKHVAQLRQEASPAPAATPAAMPAPAVAAPVPEATPEMADMDAGFLDLLLAEQSAAGASSEGLGNLAVSVDALTDTTAPETVARSADSDRADQLERAESADLLDSLFGDLAAHNAADDAAPVAAAPEEVPANAEKFVLFSLDEARYAVAIHQVIEADRVPQVTRVPNVPDFVRGVINLRGDILSLIDLRTLWGLPLLDQGKSARLLVVRSSGEQSVTGLLVDDINGIANIAPESLAVLQSQRNERIAPLLRGVYEHQQQSLHLIDLERLFLSPEIQQLAAN